MGVNLSGMEWAGYGLRSSASSVPNINFTVPRAADVSYLAANGFVHTRLPISWELLQPMLHDTPANATARALIGEPGAFNPGYESYITGLLDAHAAAGSRCILDLHNFARYRDFKFQPDGSVVGLTKDPSNPLVYAFTTDGGQVQMRIMALAPGATLKISNFVDFWTRAANKWKNHPGFGGYGIMNEPFNLPAPGGLTESSGGIDDLTIWPAYAQAAIDAIRVVDPSNPIYLGGNEWSSAASLFSKNPSWPLKGTNIIYEVHMYLDAGSSGQRFDFDTEIAAGFNAGFISGTPITLDTGVDRLKLAVDWAKPRGLKLALTETGAPTDDPRWEEMWRRLLNYARANDVAVYSWNGGAHWALHNARINHVPGWHQNKPQEPVMSGHMKAAAGIVGGALFDDGPGWALAGAAVTITVYARGNLAAPVTLNVSSSNGGTLSKTTLTIPAGANGQDTYTFTPGANRVSTLSYTTTSALPAPPPRKVFSLTDPVAYAATSLPDAAMAIIARYSACKWEMADGYTDYMLGGPATEGQKVRAISDSGYGSSPGNAMEMLSWSNDSPGMGGMVPPVMRTTNRNKNTDHDAPNTIGFTCQKLLPTALNLLPKNRAPYDITDPHFAIAAVSVPVQNSGVVFEAGHSGVAYCSELRFSNSQPQARWLDNFGLEVVLTSPTALAANAPAVISMTSRPGAQRLRVNSAVLGTASVPVFSSSTYDQMLIGWGFQRHFPVMGFRGKVYSVVTGKGVPTDSEMSVLERYLGSTAGI